MSNAPDLPTVLQESQRFPQQFQSLLLATTDASGQPEASYAPYLEDAGQYFIYVSELSSHTRNLRDQPRCGVLFIENEDQAKHVFARQRLSLQCDAQECPRDSARFTQVMALFRDKFGPFMDVIAKLQDFHLFAITPRHGGYVAGFARAYTLQGPGLNDIQHRNDTGHRSTDAQTDARMTAMAQ